MNMPARDETNRLDLAQQRLAAALSRLESALAKPAPVEGMSQEDAQRLEALEAEIASLRKTNQALESANDSALAKVDATIVRLKSVLED